MSDLYKESIDFLKNQQFDNGAWYASPNFAPYRYCWFRDGAFISLAMERSGNSAAAEKFHRWVLEILAQKAAIMEQAVSYSKNRRDVKEVPENLLLHTRYRADGSEGDMFWENHQLDGLGTWLHILADFYSKSTNDMKLSDRDISLIDSAADYLENLWMYPCYDLWEEYGDKIHFTTLTAVHAGLKAAALLTGKNRDAPCRAIKGYINQFFVKDGHFIKFQGDNRVDAAMIGAVVPYSLFSEDHPLMMETMRKIRNELLVNGGIHRYSNDTYYGGGLWLLLSAWLGWYDVLTDNTKEADCIEEWLEKHADTADGALPEQVDDHLNDPEKLSYWEKKWGKSADPLLWSHAMYVLFIHARQNS
ncbi:MAG: glycoside hydrolase [Spirochaetia bacterium]|nr:glycoside hydrolase [Spirochaetia bacterium]